MRFSKVEKFNIGCTTILPITVLEWLESLLLKLPISLTDALGHFGLFFTSNSIGIVKLRKVTFLPFNRLNCTVCKWVGTGPINRFRTNLSSRFMANLPHFDMELSISKHFCLSAAHNPMKTALMSFSLNLCPDSGNMKLQLSVS